MTVQTGTKPVIAVKAVSHTAIRVTDIDRSVDFYRRVFGYDVFIDNRAGGGNVIGVIGGLAIELLASTAAAAKVEPVHPSRDTALGHVCMAFSVEDIDAAHALLKAERLTRTDQPEQIGAVRVVFIRDPDGTLLEFIQLGGGAASLAELSVKMRAREARLAAEAKA